MSEIVTIRQSVYVGESCRWCGSTFSDCAYRDRYGDGPCCGSCAFNPGHESRALEPVGDELAWTEGTVSVLSAVLEERKRQVATYGHNDDLEDGTGPEARWLGSFTGRPAHEIEVLLRRDYEDFEEETGAPTWLHLVREELAEAFMEPSGSARLEEELIQVAALCVSWVESLRERRQVMPTEVEERIAEILRLES